MKSWKNVQHIFQKRGQGGGSQRLFIECLEIHQFWWGQLPIVCNLLRSHLGSSPNPDTSNLTRRSSLDGIPSFLLVFLSSLGLVGIFWFTDVTAAVHTLDCSSEDNFKEGDNQAEDQPDVDHLHVRGGGQLLYLAGKDGGHHQHYGQVDSNYVAEEVIVEKVGGIHNEEEEDGG